MSEWGTVALGEILTLKYGRALKNGDRKGGTVPVVGSSGIVGWHDASVVEKSTLVIGRKGSIGSLTLIEGASWPIDTAYYADFDPEIVDLRWLTHQMAGFDLKLLNKAAAVPGLNRDDVYRLHTVLPPLTEQRRIASILDEADAIRMKRRTQLAHLDDLPLAALNELDQDSVYLRPASELMPVMRNGVSPSTNGTFTAEVLTLSAITQGRFDATYSKRADFAVEPGPDKRPSKLDFLMCRGNGNRSLVGVGRAPSKDYADLIFPDTIIAGRINENIVTMPYLETVWQTRAIRDQIERLARTTNGTFKVNQDSLGSVQVPLPALESQKLFAERLARINTERDRVARALVADEELFAALQHRAFRGEL